MPELRKDPVVGRWVIIAAERGNRPTNFTVAREEKRPGPCVFCEGNELNPPLEIYSIRKIGTMPNTPGWDVRVVPNKFPALRIEGGLDREGMWMCDMMNGVGAHEVIIETPDHEHGLADLPVGQINKVLIAYRQRILDLHGDDRLKYVLIFKNQGLAAGASLQHAHSQLIATPITPKRVKEELIAAKEYFDYKRRCIFCDYIKQETKVLTDRLVVETDRFVALSPFAARFPFEIWILPKRHSPDFITIRDDEIPDLSRVMKLVMKKLQIALNDPPFNYMLHMAPYRRVRPGYWSTIDHDYHWHIELMPRLTRTAGFEWGTGFYINPTSPETAAKILRDTDFNLEDCPPS